MQIPLIRLGPTNLLTVRRSFPGIPYGKTHRQSLRYLAYCALPGRLGESAIYRVVNSRFIEIDRIRAKF